MVAILNNAILTKPTGGVVNNQDITVTANGTYTAESGYTGLGTVTVNVYNPLKTIKATKYNNNANPVITDGIADNFGSSDCLQYPLYVDGADWILTLNAKGKDSLCGAFNNNINTPANNLFCLYVDNNKFSLGIRLDNNWNNVVGSATLDENTYYYYRLAYSNGRFQTYISNDGVTFNKEGEISGSLTLPFGILLNIGQNLISGTTAWSGEIDLNKSDLTINGDTYNFI